MENDYCLLNQIKMDTFRAQYNRNKVDASTAHWSGRGSSSAILTNTCRLFNSSSRRVCKAVVLSCRCKTMQRKEWNINYNLMRVKKKIKTFWPFRIKRENQLRMGRSLPNSNPEMKGTTSPDCVMSVGVFFLSCLSFLA